MRAVLSLLGQDEQLGWGVIRGKICPQLLKDMIELDPTTLITQFTGETTNMNEQVISGALRLLAGLTLESFASPYQSGAAAATTRFWEWAVCCLNITYLMCHGDK